VSPVRLFVFLSLFAFFAAQLRFDSAFYDTDEAGAVVTLNGGEAASNEEAAADADAAPGAEAQVDESTGEPGDDRQLASMRRATTVAEVERLRDLALADIAEARAEL